MVMGLEVLQPSLECLVLKIEYLLYEMMKDGVRQQRIMSRTLWSTGLHQEVETSPSNSDQST